VPPIESPGLGNAIISVDGRYRRAQIRVTFTALQGEFTRLHLHCNVSGQNGPIAVGFVDLVAPGNDNSEVITLGSNTLIGTIGNDAFPQTDPCPEVIGRPVGDLESLAEAIDEGLIYWNLHTTAFPPGELRGQVEPLTAR